MSIVKPSLPKGTRDFLPEQMVRRQMVIDTIRGIFEKYGYGPLETPSIEKLDVLSGKYGEEGEQLIFKVLRRGTGLEELLKDRDEFTVKKYRDLIDEALRYDLTVPLARVIAMHQNDLVFPFKRYQIQPVWRADRPQRGRFREFYQCDIDTVGTTSMLADAESIAIVHEVLTGLGFKQFKIRLNNRKILDGILQHAGIDEKRGPDVFIAVDKLDKIGIDGVREELRKREITDGEIKQLFDVLEISGAAIEILAELKRTLSEVEILVEGVNELEQIIDHLQDLGIPGQSYAVDLFLVRGLGYYTGPIFECVVEEPKVGSLTGGGRYDNLIGMFLGRDIPATGTSFGIERIIEAMDAFEMFPDAENKTDVLVTLFNEGTKKASLSFCSELRLAGIKAENYLDFSKLKKQFTYADKKDIPFVALIGEDEMAADSVTIKNLSTGKQKTFSRKDGLNFLKSQTML